MPAPMIDSEVVTALALEKLRQPLDPFTGRSVADLLTQFEDPWIVGGTVWRTVYTASVVQPRPAPPDLDILFATWADVYKFTKMWALKWTKTYKGGFRVEPQGFSHIDVWAPEAAATSQAMMVSAHPDVHQRIALSAKSGIVDLRQDKECACLNNKCGTSTIAYRRGYSEMYPEFSARVTAFSDLQPRPAIQVEPPGRLRAPVSQGQSWATIQEQYRRVIRSRTDGDPEF